MKYFAFVFCLAFVVGCGDKQYHTAVVANTTLAQAIFALQDEEITAHTAKLITDAKHVQYKAVIEKLLIAGDGLTVALKDWDPSKPAPANLSLAIADVQKMLGDLNAETPIVSKVIFAVQTVLSLLRGAGVLPADSAIGPTIATAVELQARPVFRRLGGHVAIDVQPHAWPDRQCPDRLSHAHLRILLLEVA